MKVCLRSAKNVKARLNQPGFTYLDKGDCLTPLTMYKGNY